MSNISPHPLERMRELFPPAKASGRKVDAQPGVVFDPSKCTGCGLCENVCSAGGKNGTARPSRIHVMRDNETGTSFALLCQHCLDPQCMKACPNGALSKGKDGIVRMNKDLCINCGLCIAACPEAAPLRVADGSVVKCDLCDGTPACVEACPNGALSYTKGRRKQWIAPLRWLCQLLCFLLVIVVFIGSICSLSIAAFNVACPFGTLQNFFSAKSILLTTLFSGLILMGLSFVFGRVFCGWICPFGFILDLVDRLLPKRGFFRLPAFIRNRMNKYGVAAGSLAAAGAAGTQAFCTVCPIGTVCRSYGLNSFMPAVETAILPTVAALDLSERRSWCRYLCPVGATLALAAKIGLVRIEIGAPRCKKFSCMRCAAVCPMGIIPEEQLVQGISPRINMSECIMCLRCVSTCPHAAASVRFIWQKSKTKTGCIPSACNAKQREKV